MDPGCRIGLLPTRWALADKIGSSLAAIHAPVPGYAAALGHRVDRYFDRMSPATLSWRLNWSVVDDASRRLEPSPQPSSKGPADLGSGLFLRVERQTFRRLTAHPAVVFGIRIHTWPLQEVADVLPGVHLAAMLPTIPLDVARYKNLEGLRERLIAWLAAES